MNCSICVDGVSLFGFDCTINLWTIRCEWSILLVVLLCVFDLSALERNLVNSPTSLISGFKRNFDLWWSIFCSYRTNYFIMIVIILGRLCEELAKHHIRVLPPMMFLLKILLLRIGISYKASCHSLCPSDSTKRGISKWQVFFLWMC